MRIGLIVLGVLWAAVVMTGLMALVGAVNPKDGK